MTNIEGMKTGIQTLALLGHGDSKVEIQGVQMELSWRVDQSLLKYEELFEQQFLEDSEKYYLVKANEAIQSSNKSISAQIKEI